MLFSSCTRVVSPAHGFLAAWIARATWRVAALFAVVFLQACQIPQPGVDPSVTDSLTSVAEIEEAAAQFSAAYVAGDIDSLLSFYTDDVVVASGNNDFVRSGPELDNMWTLPDGRDILCHATRPEALTVEGDLAYDWGYYDGRAAQDGEPMDPFYGKYVIVWKRGTDGRWRMALDVWSRLPAPPQDLACS